MNGYGKAGKINGRALTLHSTPQGELNRNIILFTEESGLLGVTAYGVRKPGSRFGSVLEPGCLISISASSGRNSPVLAVREAELLHPFSGLKADYQTSLELLHFLDQIRRTLAWYQPEAGFFSGIVQLLELYEQGSLDQVHFATVSILLLLQVAGKMPEWTLCSECGTVLFPLFYAQTAGDGLLCRKCTGKRTIVLELNAGMAKLLDYYSRFPDWSGARVSPTGEQMALLRKLVPLLREKLKTASFT